MAPTAEQVKTTKLTLKDVCISSKDLLNYLNQKGNRHRHYKRYLTLDRLESDMKEKSLFLSLGKKWNDRVDRENFNPKGATKRNFGICFAYGESENVAMWMLYGGPSQTGVMVNFELADMKEIIENIFSVELGYYDINQNRFAPLKTISKDDGFELKLLDILYFSENEDDSSSYYIKRSDESVGAVKKDVIDEATFIKKTLPWSYENECRLILTVDASLVDSQIELAKIPVGDMYTKLKKDGKIYRAPNCSQNDRFAESRLMGKIDWNLCTDCTRKCDSAKFCKGRRKR